MSIIGRVAREHGVKVSGMRAPRRGGDQLKTARRAAATAMKAAGLSWTTIGRIMHRNETTIRYWVLPGFRAYKLADAVRRARERRLRKGYKNEHGRRTAECMRRAKAIDEGGTKWGEPPFAKLSPWIVPMTTLPAKLCDVCHSPGACCDRLELNIEFYADQGDEAAIATRDDYELPFVLDDRYLVRVVGEFQGRTLVRRTWRCPALGLGGRCTIYEHRPKPCSHYEAGSDPLCVMFRPPKVEP